METIVIDANNFIQGVSTAEWLADAGYSPKTKGHDLARSKGILYPMPATDTTDAPTARIVYKCANTAFDQTSIDEKAFLADEAGNYYSLQLNGTLTVRKTDSTNTGDYAVGFGMVIFKGYLYTAVNDEITRISLTTNAGGLNTTDFTWGTTTYGSILSGQPILLQVVEDTLYIMTTYRIHTWDGTTKVTDALRLPLDIYATASIIHPNGRDLIVFTTRHDSTGGAQRAIQNHLYKTESFAFIINTATLEYTQRIPIVDQVEGVRNVNGILYVTYGEKLGYFDDAGIHFLRDLELNLGTTTSSTQYKKLLWSQKLDDVDGMLIVPDGNNMLAVGDLGQGRMFYHPITMPSVDIIDVIYYLGRGYLGFTTLTGASTYAGYYVDYTYTTATMQTGVTWTANRYTFPQRAWIRRIEVEHEALASGTIIEIGWNDELETNTVLKTLDFSVQGAVGRTRIDCNINTSLFQPTVKWTANPKGIKKITIYYEVGE